MWLDARSAGGRALLRLEDVDHTRCRPEWAEQMRGALDWLGLDWDGVELQSERRARHEEALDALAAAGRLYPCTCTRGERRGGRRAPDGGWAYENTCRGRPLPPGGWRAVPDVLRARLPDDEVTLIDEGGMELSQTPAFELGDPVVRRRDGALAYQLVVVVDDAAGGVNRVVRGRDIASSTATQVLLQQLLGVPTPTYRHHFLLVEPASAERDSAESPAAGLVKLAKLHGSIPFSLVRAQLDGRELCGLLAFAMGLLPSPSPRSPAELVPLFSWAKVRTADLVATWSAERGLRFAEP